MFSHDLFIHSQRNIYISERQVTDKERPPSVRSISISSEEPHLLEVYKFFIICQCSNLISLSPIVINNDTFQWKGLLCCLQRQPSLPGPEVGISCVLPYWEFWPEREDPEDQCGWQWLQRWGRGEPRGCWHGAKELGPRCFCAEFPDFHRNSFVFWLHHRACEILVAPSGTEPRAHSRESTAS